MEDEQTKRQHQVLRHTLGATAAQDTLVYEESDERFNVGVGRTRDRKYILIECGSHTTTEYRYVEADLPTMEFRILAERFAVDDETAFQMLVKSSQDTNMKLTAVARWLTENAGVGARPTTS